MEFEILVLSILTCSTSVQRGADLYDSGDDHMRILPYEQASLGIHEVLSGASLGATGES
jgi:hypothetical protein